MLLRAEGLGSTDTDDISSVPAPVVVRPRRDFSRAALVRVQPRRYYDEGGFEVHDDRLVVRRTLAGKDVELYRSSVRAVVCAFTRYRQGDWRVLVVGDRGAVLARVWGPFYADEDLQRLADALGVPYRREDFASYARLMDSYPGALRYRWERHPSLAGFAFGIILCLGLAVVIAVAHAL